MRDLELKTTVGTGTFGRVRVVRHISSGKHFALKMLSKAGILAMRQLEHVKSEVSILHSVSHPFIVNLLGHSQDAKRLYLLMEYVPGGELFTKLRAEDSFSATTSRFYAAEIALAFEYLHSHGIVYRDLKVGYAVILSCSPPLPEPEQALMAARGCRLCLLSLLASACMKHLGLLL
jgi:serine/threonine protein kinase